MERFENTGIGRQKVHSSALFMTKNRGLWTVCHSARQPTREMCNKMHIS